MVKDGGNNAKVQMVFELLLPNYSDEDLKRQIAKL